MVLSMDRWVGKVAVVTGASSGIGAAIAEELVKQGVKVVGLARRLDRMEALAKKLSGKKGKLYPLKTDISKEEDILNAFKWVKENLGPVHILINNAGIVGQTNLTDGDTEVWKNIFNVNVLGLCIATREAIRDMKANNVNGHIIHINSIAGHQVIDFPGLNVYPASKFAVTALAETLRLELLNMKSKIKITNLSPGPVATEIGQDNNMKDLMQKFIDDKQMIEADNIADAVVYALSTPPHVQIQELTVRAVIEPKLTDFIPKST
ncbi:farnesol dehydrogenase [Anoplophora glabripennis]|uniref:Dehydrogenase/reductase SDR family member n=1 Tax=Anoplophora glabripennis TaxID=217634 RepID=V5GVF9_ANOGL|nr:farnesol dehydrogenase [Anoplophora glabripennis]